MEWIEAPISSDNEAFQETLFVNVMKLGFDEEDLRDFGEFVTGEFESPLMREAHALGEHAVREIGPVIEWHGAFLGGKTAKDGPPKLSRAVRRRVQRRLKKGRGNRKALLMILYSDAAARAYYEATNSK